MSFKLRKNIKKMIGHHFGMKVESNKKFFKSFDFLLLQAGGKPSTELRLPLRRFFGLCGPCVVVLCLSWRCCVGLPLSSFPCLYLAFALSRLCLRPCLEMFARRRRYANYVEKNSRAGAVTLTM